MRFRKIIWKMALPIMMLALVTGCGEEQGAATDSVDASQNSESSIVIEASSHASSEQESDEPKSEIDLLLDIEDSEKRFAEAEKLIVSKLPSFKDNFEENLKLLQIAAECKVGSSNELFLSENEFSGIKKKILEKVETCSGKSAIVYLNESDLYSDGICLSVYDDEDRMVYKNNAVYNEDGQIDTSSFYEGYNPDYYTSAYRYATELYCQYDTEGRLSIITANLLSSYNTTTPEERVDRVEYDDKGNMIKRYNGDVLVEQYEYNADGACTKKQIKRFDPPENTDTYTYEYQYRKDGYLSKSIEKYYSYWDEKNVKDITEFSSDSKIKVEFHPYKIVGLMDQLGEELNNRGIYGAWQVMSSFLKGAQFGVVYEEDYSEEKNENTIMSESTELFPKFAEIGKTQYVVGVTKDHGDGFVEYIRFYISFRLDKTAIKGCFQEHALYYLPGRY